ncbi:MAG: hypothetical protein ACPGUD_02490 [Parashewanella sp.]
MQNKQKTKRDLAFVKQALALRGMKVLSKGKNVINIDKPSDDFKKQAVEITESAKGKRSHCCAVHFSGFFIRWEI